MIKKDPETLLKKRPQLIHSEDMKVSSHVQREQDDWVLHTIMISGYDVPFIYKRKQRYQDLTGARVNLSYYPSQQLRAGFEFEIMKVVRLRRS
ncbi:MULTISPECIES: hypothetical protein [unclassified Agarivorans]|uniref:hypothetical protein n=1 Tax=unclassified Agarivorans TaxID=2636026 RepID=UPI0010DA2377|nr:MULTISPECIES: hypothetical protein [unclassified Agarivorans]MDO6684007.1 hypothetical protein [Agarivorans sp. 3_MG-2023]MDO6714260.1 hypothetical protein [Agarivorans sp. 2_MG-2023]MDO6762504.1 hypothetical protein [Agarivorans sp. 1_MG-2023]GDY24961.1 hypothetical protein AHAT_08510 [Agarivorans sp. Toyoura001]